MNTFPQMTREEAESLAAVTNLVDPDAPEDRAFSAENGDGTWGVADETGDWCLFREADADADEEPPMPAPAGWVWVMVA